MGITYRRRIPLGPRLWLNISNSGLSLSLRAGRATVNTRGRLTVRLARHWTYRHRL